MANMCISFFLAGMAAGVMGMAVLQRYAQRLRAKWLPPQQGDE